MSLEQKTVCSLIFRQNFHDFNRSYLEINLALNTNKLTSLEDVYLLFNQFPRCINNYCIQIISDNKGLGLIREGPATLTADIDVRVGEKVM